MTRDDALAAEFVIGTLDAAERAEVRTRMAVDISFAARVRAWERALAPLYELVTPIAPPPALWLSIEEDLSDSRSGMFGSRRGRGRKGQELPPAEPADAAAGEADARRRKPGETAKGGVGKALSAPFHAVKGLVRGLRSRPPEVGEAPRDDAREPKAPLEIAPPDVAPPEPPKRSSRRGRGSAGKAAAPIPHIRDDMTVPEAVAPDVRAERAQEPRHSSPDTAPEAPPVMSPVAEKGGEAQSGTAALALVPAVVLPEFKVTQLAEEDGNEAVPTPAGMAPHVPDKPAPGSAEAPATDADGASPIDEGTSVGAPVRSRPAPAGAEADAASGGRADEAARADTAPAFDTIEPAPRGDVEAAGAPLQLPETLADAEPVPAMETGEASASEPLVDWEDRIEAGPAKPLSMDVEAHPSGPAEDAAAHPSAPGAGELPAAQAGSSQADIEPELPDSSAAASAAGLAALTEELQALLFADDETDADIPLIREAAEPLPLGEPAEAPPAPASAPGDAMSRLHAEEPQAPPEAAIAAHEHQPTPAETEVAPVSEPAATATSAEQGEAAAHVVGTEAGDAPAGETGDAAPVLVAGDAPVLSAAEVDGLPEPAHAAAVPVGEPKDAAARTPDGEAADLSAVEAASPEPSSEPGKTKPAPSMPELSALLEAETEPVADGARGPKPAAAEASPSGESANQAARAGDGEGADLSAVEATEAPGSEEPQVVMPVEPAAIADAKRDVEPVEAEAAPSGEPANAGSPAGDGDGAALSAVAADNEDRRREIVEATEELEPEEFRVVMRAEKAAIADGDHRPEPVEAEAAPSGKPANEAAHFGDDQTAALSAVAADNEDRGRETVEATEAPGPEAPQMVFQADMAATPAGERGSEPVEAEAAASGEPANEAVRFGDAQAADLSAVEAANQEPRGDAVEVPIALSIEEPPAPTDAGPAAVSGRAPEPSPSETEASHSRERADPARSGDIEAAAVPTAAATDQEVSGEPQDTAPVASAEAQVRLPEGGAVPVAELGSSASDTAGDGDAVQTEPGAEPPGAGEVAADGEGPPRWVPAWPKLRERAENVGPKSRVPAMVPGRAPPAADAVSGRDGLAAPLDARPIVKAVAKRRPTAVALSAKRALEPEVKSLGIKAKAPPAPSPEGPTPTAEPVAETAARTKGAEIPELGASQPQDEVAVERPDAAPARGAGARSKPGESGKPPSDRPEDAGVAGSEAGEAAVPTSDEAERPLPPLRTVEPSPRGSRRARVLWAVGALAVALGLGIGSDMLAHWRGDGAPQPRRVELAPVFVANPPTEVRLRLDERSGRTELRIIAAEPAPPGYIYQLRLKTEGGGTHLLGTFASEMVTVSDLGRLLAGSAPGTARLSVTLDSLDAPGTPGEEVYNARIGG